MTLKIEGNWKRQWKWIISTIASGLGMWITGGLWHNLILPNITSNNEAHHEGLGITLIAYFILAFLMTFLFSRISKTDNLIIYGLKLGVLVGVLWVFPHGLAMAGTHDTSIVYEIKNTMYHIFEQGTGGIIIGWIYSIFLPKEKHNLKKAKKVLIAKNVEKIYAGKVAKKYDMSMSHLFAKLKNQAFNNSSLKKGDKVLVFCCGTGLDFPHLLKIIGKDGKIIGVDFSSEMLQIAKRKIEKNNWENIEIIEADVTKFKDKLDNKANVGICTLGMSIIPEYKNAYYNLLSNVKKQGEIIIGDMQLASGWYAKLNPFTILLAKRYGGTYEGHQNSLKLYFLMKKELKNVKKREFFFNAYYYCIGKL
jgi:demethylmenaquinone methyltransferase/2-methoxy-6-polyprenyl-1,4-benzoquinol methylase